MKAFEAKEFLSREDSRKYSPFLADDNRLVYWVNSSYDSDTGKRKKGSFFRHYPKRDLDYKNINREITIKKISDNRHKKTQEILVNILKKIIGKSLLWYFKDNRISDFSICGDLLKYVEVVEDEFRLEIKPLNFDSKNHI